jgi:hypothetical protein
VFEYQRVRRFIVFRKKTSKRIDGCRAGGVGSARRHERGGARDSQSVAVSSTERHPIGFLVPSKQAL